MPLNLFYTMVQKSQKWPKTQIKGGSCLNPLSAKPSFQLWYPGGQRLKVIFFSWSGVKSPSKCFSNTEPTTIIASRDEKRCNAMPLSSEPDRCTQVRYASVINTGNVTDDCFSSLSPSCSLTVLQQYIHVHENSEVRNGSNVGSRKQAPKNSLVCRWWRVEPSHNHTLTSLCFFFSSGPWIIAHDLYQSRRRSMVLLRSISPTPRSRVFILVFNVPSPKCFAQTWDRHSCQASKTGSALEKKERKFSTNTCGRSKSSQKMPGDGAEFSKRVPKHRRNKKPQSLNIWRQIFQKRGKQKNSSKRT